MKTNGTENRIKATEERPSASEGERSEHEGVLGLSSVARPLRGADPEVAAMPARRRFSAEYKKKILQQLDECKDSGQVGALLRREGLYSSHLTKWRRQREQGELKALGPQKRGRKEKPHNPLAGELAKLQREYRQLEVRLKQAEMIIEVQKKVSQLLGISLPENAGNS